MFFFPWDAFLTLQDHVIIRPHLEAIPAIQLPDILLSSSVKDTVGLGMGVECLPNIETNVVQSPETVGDSLIRGAVVYKSVS